VASYRTGTPFPAAIIDVANALKMVISFIDSCGGDPNKIFLSGHSAGAHLVSLLVTNSEFLRNVGIPSSAIKGVMAISGIYTIANPLSENMNDFSNLIFRSVYVNRTFGQNATDWKHASPVEHLERYNHPTDTSEKATEKVNTAHYGEIAHSSGAIAASSGEIPSNVSGYHHPHRVPPFCVFNATADLGLDNDGRKFFAILQKKNIPARYHLIPQSSHASVTKSEVVVNHCVEFIEHVLNQGSVEKKN